MAFSLAEVQRAAAALESGEFQTGPPGQRRAQATHETWDPAEAVIVIAGAAARVGTTVAATAIAEAAATEVRMVEAGPMHTTGLAEATTAELGVRATGWRQGQRDLVLIERTTSSHERPENVPPPAPTERGLTVVDISWDLTRVVASGSWLAVALASHPLVLTTTATAPGMRALEAAIDVCGRDDVHAMVLGPDRKKWPKTVTVAATGAVEQLAQRGRLHTIPFDRHLAVTGLDRAPLPPAVRRAAKSALTSVTRPPEGNAHVR
ncbi:hypothetical protein [Aeromicrobium sp.]|jgi:hypothetical protein|uniref:hypothetical protein n=1 Tax=Aeromicrobium sp. TaxID=1871063 RepID=UPI0025B81516|nr:hypothetical protein [Aeromicrobium sp.]MCK5891713.1 hypothetical protein [Aeromicrobium sp.]